jgi:hypothetical protein
VGAKLVLGARRLDRLQALAGELGLGADAAVQTDVTDREQVKAPVDHANRRAAAHDPAEKWAHHQRIVGRRPQGPPGQRRLCGHQTRGATRLMSTAILLVIGAGERSRRRQHLLNSA